MVLSNTDERCIMYFKVYTNMFHDDRLKNLMDIYLYSFLCGFSKDNSQDVYSHYNNQQLVEVFGCSSATISNSITRLEKLGLVTRFEKKGFSQKTFDFFCKRTLKVNTSLYKELAYDDYIYIQSHWLTEWKLPLRATQLLGLFNSAYHKLGENEDLIASPQDLIESMGNVNYRTYINNLNLLKELGLIEELTPKNEHNKLFHLSAKIVNDCVESEELFSTVDLEEVAKECKYTVGKFKSLIAWVRRFLRGKSSKVIDRVLSILSPKEQVRSTLEPLWEAFNFYERESIRLTIPEGADHRAGYFVQGGSL